MQTPQPGFLSQAAAWWRRPQGKVIVAATVATTSILSVGTYTFVTNDTTVSISDNGQTRDVKFWGKNVDAALAAAGVSVADKDRVLPSKDSSVRDGDRIEIIRARNVTVVDNGTSTTHQVAARTVGEALSNLNIVTADATLSPDANTALTDSNQVVTINRPQAVTVKVGGQDQALTTPAKTVGELLAQANISTDGDDIITPGPETAVTANMTVTVVKVVSREESRTEPVKHGVDVEKSGYLNAGVKEVKRQGTDGERTIVTKIVTHDGREVQREDVRNDITKKPVNRLVVVGTKKNAPKPQPAEPQPAEPKPGDAAPGDSKPGTAKPAEPQEPKKPAPAKPKKPAPAKPVAGNSVWDRLAQCESGGNWSINTGNGYYGGLQFSARTWRGLGAPGLPHQHSREVQIKYGKILQAKYGWGQWPACSKKLGLR